MPLRLGKPFTLQAGTGTHVHSHTHTNRAAHGTENLHQEPEFSSFTAAMGHIYFFFLRSKESWKSEKIHSGVSSYFHSSQTQFLFAFA